MSKKQKQKVGLVLPPHIHTEDGLTVFVGDVGRQGQHPDFTSRDEEIPGIGNIYPPPGKEPFF